MPITTETAWAEYARRTGRDAAQDAEPGTVAAALYEIRVRLARGVINLERTLVAGRQLAELPVLPGWALQAFERTREMIVAYADAKLAPFDPVAAARAGATPDAIAKMIALRAEPVEVPSALLACGVPAMRAAALALAGGEGAGAAVARLGGPTTARQYLSASAHAELEDRTARPSRDGAAHAFWETTTRALLVPAALGREVRPSEISLLAAGAGVEPIASSADRSRDLWEQRIRRWRAAPPPASSPGSG